MAEQRQEEEEEEGVIQMPVPSLYSYRIPSCYRFDPTDQELVVYFLSNKISGTRGLRYDPSTIIPTMDLYGPSSEPWRLCEEAAFPYALTPTEFFCFTTPLNHRNQPHGQGDRCHRRAGFGTWYSTGNENEIWHEGVLVGRSSSFSFKVPPPGVTGPVDENRMVATHWVMDEFRLESDTEFQTMVVCKIRNQKKDDDVDNYRWKTPWWEAMYPYNNNTTRKRLMPPSSSPSISPDEEGNRVPSGTTGETSGVNDGTEDLHGGRGSGDHLVCTDSGSQPDSLEP